MAALDLGHLELEQLADQLLGAARQHDLRALRAGAHLDDHGLDARAVLVALAGDLLAAREQRLDPAEIDERVARVGLLDDAGHDVADAALVLREHHLALGLADPLQDHLLRGLRGDAAEVALHDVRDGDLVGAELRPVDDGLGLDGLGRLALGRRLRHGALLDLELLGVGVVDTRVRTERLLVEQDRVHVDISAVAVQDHACVRRGARRLLVGGEQGVLEGGQKDLSIDALRLLELPDSRNDLLRHQDSSTRWLLRTSASGIGRGSSRSGSSSTMRSSSASRSAPVNRRRPSIASRVSTAIRLPTLR